MRRSIAVLIAVVGMGSAVLPVTAAAPRFSLTAWPAKVVVPATATDVSFGLYNGGTEPERVVVLADAWLRPSESSFTLAPGAQHTTTAHVIIPSVHDAGDHDGVVSFVVPATGQSLLNVSRGVATQVIIATESARVVNALRILGLQVPLIADSWDTPAVNLTLDNSGSNVHQLVTLAPLGQVLLLRGQQRVIHTVWAHHAFVGIDHITVANQQASTLFLPWKLLGLILLLGLVLTLLRPLRRRR